MHSAKFCLGQLLLYYQRSIYAESFRSFDHTVLGIPEKWEGVQLAKLLDIEKQGYAFS
jgi:hypothetical protein